MRQIVYRKFSSQTHLINWKSQKFSDCQFELTFKCDLHCRHCYTDCFNKKKYWQKELNTKQVKSILDKLHQAGVIWLCFTGGDPLTRIDFFEIYAYAKKKGFIVTLFTNGYSITREMSDYLKENPPFAIEITLNDIEKNNYEKITRRKNSFENAINGIHLLKERNIPLKIKTQVTKDNFIQLPKISKYVKDLDLEFLPCFLIFPRLNGDKSPCKLRVPQKKFINSYNKYKKNKVFDETKEVINDFVYNCATRSGNGFFLDPYGNMSLCNLIRKPSVNLLKTEINSGLARLLKEIRGKKFITDSECRKCNIRESCLTCAGKAYLETGHIEKPVPWFCKLAKNGVLINAKYN